MTTKEIGDLGEKLSVKLLRKKHYKVLKRNLHVSHNELDIVAFHRKTKMIVFVEVKTRSVGKDLYSPFGTPGAAVNRSKQKRTVDAAKDYLRSNFGKWSKLQPRIDVIEVYLSKADRSLLNINHIENAFGV